MIKNKINFLTEREVANLNPYEYLKSIIPGIDVDKLDVEFLPLNNGVKGNGVLYENIRFQTALFGKNDSMYSAVSDNENMYTLAIRNKGKKSFTEFFTINRRGEDFILSIAKGNQSANTQKFRTLENLGIIPSVSSNKRYIHDLNNNEKVLQTVTDIIGGKSINSNAQYSELGQMINRTVPVLGFKNNNSQSIYKKTIKTILNKNISNIEHNNQITIGNVVSNKDLGGIISDYDIYSENMFLSRNQFNSLALFEDKSLNAKEQINKAIEFKKGENPSGIIDNGTIQEAFESRIKAKLGGEDVSSYKINFDQGKDNIKSITAFSSTGKSFEFNQFQMDGSNLFSGSQYIKEKISTDMANLYSLVPNDKKGEIRNLITSVQEEYQNSNKSMEFANKKAKQIRQKIGTMYAESHGVNLDEFISVLGDKELKKIDVGVIEGLILSGRNFDYGLNVGKQSQNTQGGVKKLPNSFAHPLSYLNAEGQRKAQSIDQLSSLSVTDDNGESFDVGRSINRIGEDIKQLQYKKLDVESAQLNAMNELMKENNMNGTSTGIFDRRAFTLYTNSNFAFQDSNTVSTQVAMAGAGTSDVNRFNVDFASLNLDNSDVFSEDEIRQYLKNNQLDNRNILVENTFENKLVRHLIGEDNYTKYASKNDYIREIKSLNSLMPSNLDLNREGDRKRYTEAMELITNKYNEINEKYLIKGNQLGQAQIIASDIVNDGQFKSISKSNFAFIDDIKIGKTGFQINAKNISVAGEGTKLMNGMVKLTVQNTKHLMGIKNGKDFLPVEMFINEKQTAKKRGFSGTFISSFLQTAYTHAETYGNKSASDFDSYIRKNGMIEYNGKTANIMDLLNLDISMNNGSLLINDKSMGSVINQNILNKDSLPYEDYLKNISQNIERHIGKITDKDSLYLGNLITSKLEDVYSSYIKGFNVSDRHNMQITYNDAKLFTSTLNNAKDGVEEVTPIGKAYRFINNFVKMNESISRKDQEGLKLGRISNFVLDEQMQTGLVDLIENKILDNTEKKMTKISGLTAFPGTPFERNKEIYKNTFGSNAIDISSIDSSIRNVNISLNEYMANSPIAKSLIKINEDGELQKETFGELKNFDSKLLTKYRNFFDNKEKANKILLKNFYSEILGNNFNENLLNKFSIGMGSLLTEKDGLLTSSSRINSALRTQLFHNLKETGLDDTTVNKLVAQNINMYKTLYGISAISKFKDLDNLNDNEYLFLTNISKNSENMLDDYINKFHKRLEGKMNSLDLKEGMSKDVYSATLNILKNIKSFTGENLFSLIDAEQTFKHDTMPFFIDELAVDGQGVIVYNKELANVESIAHHSKEIKEIRKKQEGFRNAMELINGNNRSKALVSIFEEADYTDRARLFTSLGLNFETSKVRNMFQDGGTYDFRAINKKAFPKNGNYLSTEVYNMVKNANTSESIFKIIDNLEITLKDISGKKDYANRYTALKEDLDSLKSSVQESMSSTIKSKTNLDEYFNKTYKNKTNIIGSFLTDIEKKINSSYDTAENKLTNLIFNRTNEASKTLFKNKGYMYNAPTMRVKNSFAFSPREGTGLIDFIADESEQFMGKGYYNEKYNKWIFDKNKNPELENKFKEFKKAFNLLYGDHYSKDYLERILNSEYTYSKDELSKSLNKLSGIAIGTEEQYDKLGLSNFFGRGKHTYQAVSRNPHQYLSSIRGTRFVRLNQEDRNLSFFAKYYGNESKIKGIPNNLLLVGKRSAMSAHGDFDGDVFQGLFFSGYDFGATSKRSNIEIRKRLSAKMEYMNILADISRRDLEKEILFDSRASDFKRVLNLARIEHGLDSSVSDNEVFNKIKNAYFINKAEYIRTTEELIDENKKHSIIPEFKKALLNVDGIDIDFDKSELSKVIGKMSSKDKLNLFLKTLDEDKLKNIETYIGSNQKINEYTEKYLKAKGEGNKAKAFLRLLEEFNDSKNNIKWNNSSLAKSSYADYTGINRTGIVHSKLSSYRESATVVLHADGYAKKHGMKIEGITDNLKSIINSTIGFSSISEYIEGIGVSAKLGGEVNPYSILNSFEGIRESFENIENSDFMSGKKIDSLAETLKRNMKTKLDDIEISGVKLKQILNTDKITSESILNYVTNNTVLDEKIYNNFIKLVDLEGKGKDLSKYNGLQLLRGISNLTAIYTNSVLNSSNGGVDVINGFKKLINSDNGNLIARSQRLGSADDIQNNLGQNFRLVRQAYQNISKVARNSLEYIQKFFPNKAEQTQNTVKEIEEIISNLSSYNVKRVKPTNKARTSRVGNNLNINATTPKPTPTSTPKPKPTPTPTIDPIQPTPKVDPIQPTLPPNSSGDNINGKTKINTDNINVDNSTTKNTINMSDEALERANSEIERLREVINSKDTYISDLENRFSSTKSDYDSKIKEGVEKIKILKESIKESARNKTAGFMNTDGLDRTNEAKKFISEHKQGILLGTGLAVIGTFLKIFQSNRSVVKLNINEEEYDDSEMPLQRQFGGYEINTNIRSFYR